MELSDKKDSNLLKKINLVASQSNILQSKIVKDENYLINKLKKLFEQINNRVLIWLYKYYPQETNK